MLDKQVIKNQFTKETSDIKVTSEAEREKSDIIKVAIPEWEGDIPYKTKKRYPADKCKKIQKALVKVIEENRQEGKITTPNKGNVDGFHTRVTIDGEVIDLDFSSGRPKLITEDCTTGKIDKSGFEREENTERHEDGHTEFGKILDNFEAQGMRAEYVQKIINQLNRLGKWRNLAIGILNQWDLSSLGLPANEKTDGLRQKLDQLLAKKELFELENFFNQVSTNLGNSSLLKLKEGIVNEIYANACGRSDEFILDHYAAAKRYTENKNNGDDYLPTPIE